MTTADDQLVSYLRDAHALEQQAKAQLQAGLRIAGDPDFEQTIHGHLMETQEHERLVAERLEAHGASPSTVKDVAGKISALGLGTGAMASPDTPAKLAVAAYAFEHLEIASYELLRRVAERVGDHESVEVADRILAQERSASEKISWHFDAVVERSLEKQGVSS